MGFEVYLECFGESERTGISRAAVRSLFPIVEAESFSDNWCVRYGADNECNFGVTAIATDDARLKSFYIDRPCGDALLWEGLLTVLHMGSVVMFWPGGPLVVADENVAARIPKEMSDGMGKPKFVSSVEQLLELFRET